MRDKMESVFLILCALFFLGKAAGDFAGYNAEIKPEYRDKPGLKVWQRKRAWANLVIGVDAILFLFLERFPIAVLILAPVVFCAFYKRHQNDKNFIEGKYAEEGSGR